MVIRNMRGTTSAAAATIRAVGAGQRQGSCDHAGGLQSRVRVPDRPISSRFASLDTSATAIVRASARRRARLVLAVPVACPIGR